MTQAIVKTLDRRRSYVKHQISLGAAQMVRYFSARYSWGQPCDPRRANDWGTLCAYLRDCQVKGLAADFHRKWTWPSGNVGSISGMINNYHDGWELLSDLGLTDELDYV